MHDTATAQIDNPQPLPQELPTPSPASPVFNDSRTLDIIRDFLSSEKPQGTGPAEVAMTVALLASKAVDHPVNHSHQTLAAMLGCDEKTIRRSEETLKSKELGWISQTSRKGRSKLTTVNLDRLPTIDPTLSRTPTERAHRLVQKYAEGLRKYLPYKKLHKHWYKAQAWNAQKILNRCGDNMTLAILMLRHAFNTPEHRKAAGKDLYSLWGRWKQIEKSYAKELEEQLNGQAETSAQPTLDTIDHLITQTMEGEECRA